jgi:PAS domain S-box-containing protein
MAKRARRKRGLFESERRFRLLVEGVIDYAIYMLDPNGIISNWNAGAKRIKGYDADEVIGQHFQMFYSPEDRKAGLPARSLETARETGKFEAGLPARSLETARKDGKFEAEGWRVRKDGSKFLASVVIDALYEENELVGFAKITRDITERNQAADALRESERHFRLLVNGVTDYALYMLDLTGVVTNWNAGAQRIKGYLPNEIIGQHFSRFYSNADQAAGRPARALRLALESGRYEEEGWRVRKDGTFFWASVVIDPIRDDENRLIGFAKITRDITERREAQQELEKLQLRLAQSQKLDALGQLTGGVAHDFNNLLMVITGSLNALKKTVGDDPKALRAVQAIDTASQRGAALTSQLLSFARRQSVNPQTIDVRDSIFSVRDVLDTGLGSAIELQIEADNRIWPITVDRAEFETALVNLVINARDAMPKGGKVTVQAKNVFVDDGVAKGDFVAIKVRDTGTGIPDDVVAKIFDPFFTTKPIGKGTGLGLSQVHGFVHQAGGTIAVDSELGKGTSFTVCLPRSTAVLTRRPEQLSHRGTGTVLLVEDNPDVANASTGLLEELGYAVRWASDVDTALSEIAANGIDLVLSDIVMPGKMDGLALARVLKQQHPGLPILLATGYSEAARNAGAEFPILRKPYQIHELNEALSRLAVKAPDAASGH